ncbi:MAG: Do family serine endopeptidase [Siculibacillus sp.]
MKSMPAVLALLPALALLATVGVADAQTAVPESRAQVSLSFAPVVKAVAPAVVNVYATRRVEQHANPLFADPLFRQFFGGGIEPPARIQSSLGSGTIVDRSGLIVTNHHVIRDADEVKIALADKREFEADIVLKDERSDLAVIRIRQKGDYPFAPIGDSEALQVGDLVLALGNPFGVGQTVTQGIVSALARTQVGAGDTRFFIQTDAAINPGNSGGALVDLQGRLVGVPSSIYSKSGGSIGIGFAIPSTTVRFVLEQARTGSVVRRPWLGATLQNVSADVAEGLGMDRPIGALVTGLVAGGPATQAGLKIGDLLLTVDGHEVDDPDAFGFRFGTRPLGGAVAVELLRAGKKMRVSIASQAAPETVPRDARTIDGHSPFAGVTILNLSPAVAEEMRAPFDAQGVVVSVVAPGSPAQQLGFQKGDVVIEVNGQAIETTATLARAAATTPTVWRLVIQRGGQTVRMAFRG